MKELRCLMYYILTHFVDNCINFYILEIISMDILIFVRKTVCMVIIETELQVLLQFQITIWLSDILL